MLKKIKRFLFCHRLAALGRSLSIASTPVILLGTIVMFLHKTGRIQAHENLTTALVLAASAIAWIPLYVRMRGSLLAIARRADTVLGSGGVLTAGADIFSYGKPRTPWAWLIEERGRSVLAGAGTSRIVPGRGYALFIPPAAALAIFALTCNFGAISAQVKKIPWDEKDKLTTRLRLFSPADEELLTRINDNLKKELEEKSRASGDAKLESLRKEIQKTLSSFPKSGSDLEEYMKKIEQLKSQMNEIDKAEQEQMEALEDMGKKMDGKLLDELGKKLEEKKLDEAAQTAEKIAGSMEKSLPSPKAMEEAASDLKDAAAEGEKKVQEQEQKGGAEGKKEGEKAKGEEKQPGQQDGKGMDKEKFDKLKKTLEQLGKLAEMFNIKSPDQIPDGLKDLAKQFSDMDLNKEQAKELQEMIDKLENLKNMMVEAKEGEGKSKYSDLKKKFESQASGGKQGQEGKKGEQGQQGQPGQQGQQGQGEMKGQPGQKGQGEPGATPGGKTMLPGEGQGEQGSKENAGGKQQGGQGKKGGPENPSQNPVEAEKENSQQAGQEGWGNGTAPHLGPAASDAGNAKYDDMDMEGKDSPGPLKKDIIKGAAENGFVGTNYKKVYEEYSSIIDEILEEENVPSLYRYYVNKYFELIAPRE
jgi:hypothetical protein